MVENSKISFVVHIDKSDICKISIPPQTSTSNRAIGCSIIIIVLLYFYISQPHHLTPCTDIDNRRKSRPRQIGFRIYMSQHCKLNNFSPTKDTLLPKAKMDDNGHSYIKPYVLWIYFIF